MEAVRFIIAGIIVLAVIAFLVGIAREAAKAYEEIARDRDSMRTLMGVIFAVILLFVVAAAIKG